MSSISSPTSVYKPYATMRILKVNSDAIDDICHKMRKSNKGWTQTRVVNMALLQFCKDFPKMSDVDVEELFALYDKALKKQNDAVIDKVKIVEKAKLADRRRRYAKKA